MDVKNIPIIIGAAQFTQHKDTSQPLDPLSLIVKTSKMAIEDTQTKEIVDIIDAVYMVNIDSWSYEDAPGKLSKILGIKPIKKVYLPDGGNTPQMLVNRAARAISAGKSRSILITGGEALYSRLQAKKDELTLNWPKRKKPKYIEGELWDWINEFENRYGFKYPPYTYAIFETAIRAASGRTIDEHKKHLGKLFEHFSMIASKNPYSWTQESYTADEIIIPSPENRYITHPYTKRMCSNLFVDQAGTIIMANEELAKSLCIDRKLWVYLMGGADLNNIHSITQRPRLDDSPATREGSKIALRQAGLTLNDIDAFDIYSCFPSIVEIIMNELGLAENDHRDLTLTGGLPYFGGPLSNYSLHSIINAVDLIRIDPSLKVMIIANGGYNTKQSIGIYGSEPPTIEWGVIDESGVQQSILEGKLPDPVEMAKGKLAIDGYTIIYDRFGHPERGIVIGTLENGRRTLALIKSGPKNLKHLEKQELVGKTVIIMYDPSDNRNFVISND